MRKTKEEVQGMFKRLAKAMGIEIVGTAYNTPTDDLVYMKHGLDLDYNATYGGYLVELVHEDTSISHPLSGIRLPAKEMYHALYMACCAIEFMNQNKEGK